MSRPRLQLRRDKSSVVADCNCRLYLINRRTAKYKKASSVSLCIQNQSVIKRSIKLKKQNENYCVSREKLLISGDIESNPGPVTHGTSTHTTPRNPSMTLLKTSIFTS